MHMRHAVFAVFLECSVGAVGVCSPQVLWFGGFGHCGWSALVWTWWAECSMILTSKGMKIPAIDRAKVRSWATQSRKFWGGPRQRDRKRNHFLNPKRVPNHQRKTVAPRPALQPSLSRFSFPRHGTLEQAKSKGSSLFSANRTPYCLARRSVTKTRLAICKGPAAIAEFPNTGRCGGVSHCGVRGVKHLRENHNRHGAEFGLGCFEITMLFNQSRADSRQSGHSH